MLAGDVVKKSKSCTYLSGGEGYNVTQKQASIGHREEVHCNIVYSTSGKVGR